MRAALIALWLATATAAAAQAPSLPPTDQRLPAQVDAWIAANVVAGDFSLIHRDAEQAYLVHLVTGQDMGPTTVRAWLRVEYFDPPTTDRRFRSVAALYDVDCAHPRLRYLAADMFAAQNRGGERVETRDETSPRWSYPRPRQFEERLVQNVCATRARRLALEGPLWIPAEP